MKSFTPEAQKALDGYLQRLEETLTRLHGPHHHEIFQEIQSHIYERLEQFPSPLITASEVLAVLYKLGEPESYVPLYLTEAYLERGFSQRSPRFLARGIWHWMKMNALSYLYSFPFFLLYALSFALLSFGTAKVLFPHHVAIFYEPIQESSLSDIVGDNNKEMKKFHFAIGFKIGGPLEGAERDLLGYWLVPLGIGGGLILGLGATVLLRWVTRKLLEKQKGGYP
ncbi:MAG: hypothetical protein RMJ96_01470 [Candidatus Bipolaricaulota bacterium]|nr:hypothetical protein [Candidatus Bipolaricaulota bacterium]MDW8110262.1 hypothetical protein [Candidatus Bipolaricaulota bacterium]